MDSQVVISPKAYSNNFFVSLKIEQVEKKNKTVNLYLSGVWLNKPVAKQRKSFFLRWK